jgi:hypothetical protein
LTQSKTKNNRVCYKSKPPKTKNTVAIGKHPKYLFFIHPSLLVKRLTQPFLSRFLKILTILNMKNKIQKLLPLNRKT